MSVPRDERGRVMPGFSLNPEGRRANDTEFRHVLKKSEPEAIAELTRLMVHGKREATKLRALEIFFDRLYGKVRMPVDVDLNLSRRLQEMSVEELMELDQRLDGIAMLPAAVNGHDGES